MSDKSKYKKGQLLYRVYIDEETLKVELNTFKVSSVTKSKNGVGHKTIAILLHKDTWINRKAEGKRFSKEIDMGWAKNIPSYFKHRTLDTFANLHTTKLKAITDPNLLKDLEDLKEGDLPKIEAKLKALKTKIKNTK